jgi:hypothetical protein
MSRRMDRHACFESLEILKMSRVIEIIRKQQNEERSREQ